MKKPALLLGIICLFIFIGCNQEEKPEQPDDPMETIEDIKGEGEGEGEETTINKEAVETAKKAIREPVEEVKKEVENPVEGVTEKVEETEKVRVLELEVIEMKNENAFPQHRMGIVNFNHETHAADKPQGYNLGCGKCHHDENGEPLVHLKHGDEVQSCYECHNKDGIPRRDPAMSQEKWEEEQLKYYYGAIHKNCMECHKKMGGPVSCTECHPRPR